MKIAARQLFKTFIFSVILSIAINSIYYAVSQKGGNYSNTLPKIIEGIVLLNIIVFVMSLPSLFLINPLYWNNLPVRLPLYFGGSVAFIVTVFTMPLPPQYKVIYLVTGFTFLIVHTVFYYLRVKKA